MSALDDRETLLLLGRMDGKLDAALVQMTGLSTELKDVAKRVSALERWRAWVYGAAAAAGGAGGVAGAHIIDLFAN